MLIIIVVLLFMIPAVVEDVVEDHVIAVLVLGHGRNHLRSTLSHCLDTVKDIHLSTLMDLFKTGTG